MIEFRVIKEVIIMAEQYPIGKNREENYNYMVATAKAFIQGEKNLVANLSNLSSIINLYVDTINWAGFYLMEEGELVLGPFQGKPACIRIPLGKGVCGTAAAEGRTIIVEDVHAFPGHIACDAASNSEIVIPITKNGTLIGVLDIDSPIKSRFKDEEKIALEAVVAVLEESIT